MSHKEMITYTGRTNPCAFPIEIQTGAAFHLLVVHENKLDLGDRTALDFLIKVRGFSLMLQRKINLRLYRGK